MLLGKWSNQAFHADSEPRGMLLLDESWPRNKNIIPKCQKIVKTCSRFTDDLEWRVS